VRAAEKVEMIKIGEVYFFHATGMSADGTSISVPDRFTALHNEIYPAWISFAVHVDFYYYAPPNVLLSFRVAKSGDTIYHSGRLPLPFARSDDENSPHSLSFRLDDMLFKGPGQYFVEILLNDTLSYRKALALD
jgi:hypothetical protein